MLNTGESNYHTLIDTIDGKIPTQFDLGARYRGDASNPANQTPPVINNADSIPLVEPVDNPAENEPSIPPLTQREILSQAFAEQDVTVRTNKEAQVYQASIEKEEKAKTLKVADDLTSIILSTLEERNKLLPAGSAPLTELIFWTPDYKGDLITSRASHHKGRIKIEQGQTDSRVGFVPYKSGYTSITIFLETKPLEPYDLIDRNNPKEKVFRASSVAVTNVHTNMPIHGSEADKRKTMSKYDPLINAGKRQEELTAAQPTAPAVSTIRPSPAQPVQNPANIINSVDANAERPSVPPAAPIPPVPPVNVVPTPPANFENNGTVEYYELEPQIEALNAKELSIVDEIALMNLDLENLSIAMKDKEPSYAETTQKLNEKYKEQKRLVLERNNLILAKSRDEKQFKKDKVFTDASVEVIQSREMRKAKARDEIKYQVAYLRQVMNDTRTSEKHKISLKEMTDVYDNFDFFNEDISELTGNADFLNTMHICIDGNQKLYEWRINSTLQQVTAIKSSDPHVVKDMEEITGYYAELKKGNIEALKPFILSSHKFIKNNATVNIPKLERKRDSQGHFI